MHGDLHATDTSLKLKNTFFSLLHLLWERRISLRNICFWLNNYLSFSSLNIFLSLILNWNRPVEKPLQSCHSCVWHLILPGALEGTQRCPVFSKALYPANSGLQQWTRASDGFEALQLSIKQKAQGQLDICGGERRPVFHKDSQKSEMN